jgi:alpha-L-rhamnosidase
MSTLTPTGLRCEWLADPLAIERPDPRLSWRSTSTARDARQTAYRVVVARSAADLAAEKELLWDSGKVASDASSGVHYAGKPLASCERVSWKVQVWDEAGKASAWSAPALWAMGLLARSDWRAKWIHTPYGVQGINSNYFRRAFTAAKPVADARLYATAKGIFLAWIDGQPVSDEQFAPGWTDYNKRILYRCHDVTALLRQPGEHVLGAQLNDGWFKGPVGWEGKSQLWGGLCHLLMQLRIQYADGSVEWIATDGDWRAGNSPVISSSFLKGEIYDAGAEPKGWDRPGFDAAKWRQVPASPVGETPALQPHPGPPVRRLEEIKPIAKWQQRPGIWIFDLGQNIAGRVRIKVKAPGGTTIRLRHAEMVTTERELYTDNLRSAISTDVYTAAGSGVEVWEPRFTFHGFQYIEVAGWPGEPNADDIAGIVLSSDCPVAGAFECSDPLINKLYGNIVRTQRANYIEIPTDCPQRDERLGWTGDAQAYIRTALCSRDIAAFFTKWEQDLRDAQTVEGAFPNVAPQVPGLGDGWGLNKGDAAWGDAGTICPWTVWRCYDDADQLDKMFPAMVRWVEYLDRLAIEGMNLRYPGGQGNVPKPGPCFGDWLNVDSSTPLEIIMTAFYARSTEIVAEAAGALGKEAEAKRFRELHAKIVKAFQREFIGPDARVTSKRDDQESQTSYLLALHFDLMPENLREQAVARLLAQIEKRNWHLSTGFVGMPYLLPVLSRFGKADVAYRLLMNKTYPSWLYSVTQGATSIWERWNGWKKDEGPADPGMNSYSHYAYGACGEWLFSDVAGIELLERGFKKIRVRPRIGGGLSSAQAWHDCIHGRIESRWKVDGREIALAVEIPANTRAEVWIPTSDPKSLREGGKPWAGTVRSEPGYAVIETGSGKYAFTATHGATAQAAAR